MVPLLLRHRARRAGCYAAASLLRPVVRKQRWLCSVTGPRSKGSPATQPKSTAARLRARVVSALQKDGSKELDTSLPLGYVYSHRSQLSGAFNHESYRPLTGFVLVLRNRETLRRIFSAAKPELPLLAGAAVALVVSSATSLIFPKAVGVIVDEIGPAAEPDASDSAKEQARSSVRQMSLG